MFLVSTAECAADVLSKQPKQQVHLQPRSLLKRQAKKTSEAVNE